MASYYVWSGASGSANGTSWANAYLTLTLAFSGKAAGDVFYVAHDHAESTASLVQIAAAGTVANPTKVICVDRAGSVPPVSADRRATAQVSATGNVNIFLNGIVHYDGIIFNCSSGANGSNLVVSNASASIWQRYDNCSFRPGATAGTGNNIVIGNSTSGGALIEWNNCTVSFGSVNMGISGFGTLRWRNTPSALLGTIPTTLFTLNTARAFAVECIGVDLSAAGSGKTIVQASNATTANTFKFIDCKLDASVTKSTVPASHGSTEVDFTRSGSAGTNYTVYSHRVSGLLIEETTIVRTGGASDGTTPLSWKVVTTATCTFSMPFTCPPIAVWNDTTGTSVTATIEGIGAALPTDAEVWVDIEYLGDASSPQGSFVSDGKADLLATAANQTSSSETWGGSTTAFKLSVSFTPQQKGWVYAFVRIGKASSTFYIDPLVTLT